MDKRNHKPAPSVAVWQCGSQKQFCPKEGCFSLWCPNRFDEDSDSEEDFRFCACCEREFCPDHGNPDCIHCGMSFCDGTTCPSCDEPLCPKCTGGHLDPGEDGTLEWERQSWKDVQSYLRPFY